MNTERNAFLLGTTSATGLFTPAGAMTTGGFETRVVCRDIVGYQVGFWAVQRRAITAQRDAQAAVKALADASS